MRRMTVALVLLVVAWTITISPSAAASSAPPPAPSTDSAHATLLLTPGPNEVHFLSYNLGGGCAGCSGTGVQKANELADLALNGQPPIAVSVQESCRNTSFARLEERLVPLGYISHFYPEATGSSSNPVCGSTTGQYGVGVLWLGSCWGGSGGCRFSLRYNDQAGGQNRGYACGRGAFPTYFVCSTHLTELDDTTAAAQADQYYTAAMLMDLQARSTAAGYFNLEPPQDTEFENHNPPWVEAWCFSGWLVLCPTTDAGVKIDYIYSSMCWKRNGAVFPMVHSDHHALQGFMSGC